MNPNNNQLFQDNDSSVEFTGRCDLVFSLARLSANEALQFVNNGVLSLSASNSRIDLKDESFLW